MDSENAHVKEALKRGVTQEAKIMSWFEVAGMSTGTRGEGGIRTMCHLLHAGREARPCLLVPAACLIYAP